MCYLKIPLLLVSLFVLSTNTVYADEIFMKNGDHLKGKVVSMDSGKLVFNTPYTGDITIDWDFVARITTETPLQIKLEDDLTLHGKAVGAEEGSLVLEPEGELPTEPITLSQVQELKPYEPGEKRWEVDGYFTFGFSNAKGNTVNEKLNFDGELKFSKEPHSLTLYGEARFETERGTDTKNNDLYSIEYRHSISKKMYLYATTVGLRDEFKDLKFQLTLAGGAGYRFWDSTQKNLSIGLGPGYVKETYTQPQKNFGNTDDRDYAAATWSLDSDMWFFERLFQGYYRNWGSVAFDDSSIWQVNNRIGVRVPLVKKLFGDISYRYDYNNFPADGKDKLDREIRLKLGLNF